MSLGFGLIGLVITILAVFIMICILGKYLEYNWNIWLVILMIIGDIGLFVFGCRIIDVAAQIGD